MGRRRRGGKSNPWQGDRLTQQARDEGYAARSVYKLQEIQQRFQILKPGQRVLDLGCTPGSWWVFAARIVGASGCVLGVDIAEPEAEAGPFLKRSILEVTSDELRDALGGPPAVVLSDMAPRTTGDPFGDHVRQLELARAALQVARATLAVGGHFVCKVFDGEEAHDFVTELRGSFEKVKRVRPDAVRRRSREFFVVATGFREAP